MADNNAALLTMATGKVQTTGTAEAKNYKATYQTASDNSFTGFMKSFLGKDAPVQSQTSMHTQALQQNVLEYAEANAGGLTGQERTALREALGKMVEQDADRGAEPVEITEETAAMAEEAARIILSLMFPPQADALEADLPELPTMDTFAMLGDALGQQAGAQPDMGGLSLQAAAALDPQTLVNALAMSNASAEMNADATVSALAELLDGMPRQALEQALDKIAGQMGLTQENGSTQDWFNAIAAALDVEILEVNNGTPAVDPSDLLAALTGTVDCLATMEKLTRAQKAPAPEFAAEVAAALQDTAPSFAEYADFSTEYSIADLPADMPEMNLPQTDSQGQAQKMAEQAVTDSRTEQTTDSAWAIQQPEHITAEVPAAQPADEQTAHQSAEMVQDMVSAPADAWDEASPAADMAPATAQTPVQDQPVRAQQQTEQADMQSAEPRTEQPLTQEQPKAEQVEQAPAPRAQAYAAAPAPEAEPDFEAEYDPEYVSMPFDAADATEEHAAQAKTDRQEWAPMAEETAAQRAAETAPAEPQTGKNDKKHEESTDESPITDSESEDTNKVENAPAQPASKMESSFKSVENNEIENMDAEPAYTPDATNTPAAPAAAANAAAVAAGADTKISTADAKVESGLQSTTNVTEQKGSAQAAVSAGNGNEFGAVSGTATTTSTAAAAKTDATMSSMLEQMENIEKLTEAMKMANRGAAKQITLQLSPPELGKVMLRVESRGGVVNAYLRVEKPEAAAQLTDSLQQLRDNLKTQGVELGELDIRQYNQPAGDQQSGQNRRKRQSDEDESDSKGKAAAVGQEETTEPAVVRGTGRVNFVA